NDIPANRIEDIRGMIDFISQYPGVDKQRIGAFGICGGGGYTVAAAQSDHRIKAVAALSMFNTGRVRRNGYGDSQLSTVQQRLMQAAEARQHQAETGVVVYPPKQAIPTEEQLAAMPFDLYREGIFYYGTSKYRHENDGASAPVACMLDLMMWDATDRMELITQPLLLMAGEKADSKYMTDEAMEKATGTNRKELFVIPGATHIKTYYVEEYVEQERRKLVEFF
ncbi:MAG: alpha/beta hydrolase, partial [Bacteroidales bacterium]|nr:alpha/beta hydrolase [Bacteroidales bacterium]